ncbi:conserved hypothetical protein [Desulfatibacillum aliphaticivorans]|uniref:HD domain-containing protein n=1 Tax=Desulfatibacillum aliphaticivorans TaxID=218208 RepID=B8FA15_DESAL|nr:HD domain-containing protein [Desulfatibacillum aliphaticivorans]ACL03111.1 conserved hypothetical protein [Desulfatibacillum aliphaticivorans]
MDDLYVRIRQRAREIGSKYPEQTFYSDHADLMTLSRKSLEDSPILIKLHNFVASVVDDDLGHGLDHCVKVTIDAGILFLIHADQKNMREMERERGLLLVQAAGLLHDISRKEKRHAHAGALAAAEILEDFPFSQHEIDAISLAIRNHEAFHPPDPCASDMGQAISDCLYDADKFRWGPDNFTDTVWYMVSFFKSSVSMFLERYEEGIKGIVKIKETFRTDTGQQYGPEFVDAGLEIGEEIRQMLKDEFL